MALNIDELRLRPAAGFLEPCSTSSTGAEDEVTLRATARPSDGMRSCRGSALTCSSVD